MTIKFDDSNALALAIAEAADQHHKFETQVLLGERDEDWAQWYADYIGAKFGGAYHYQNKPHNPEDEAKVAFNYATKMAKARQQSGTVVATVGDPVPAGRAWDVVGPQDDDEAKKASKLREAMVQAQVTSLMGLA